MLFRPPFAGCILVALAFSHAAPASLQAQSAPSVRPGVLEVQADYVSRQDEQGQPVLLLRGRCRLKQGQDEWTAPRMVLWEQSRRGESVQILAYLEGTADELAAATVQGRQQHRGWLLAEISAAAIEYSGRPPLDSGQVLDDPVYKRAVEHRDSGGSSVQLAQYLLPPSPAGNAFPPHITGLRRRVTIGPRFLGERLEWKAEPAPGTVPLEYLITVSGGVNIVVDNVPLNIDGQTLLTSIDLTADSAVIWTDAEHVNELGSFDIDAQTPFQVYLEGNIVVRQGSSEVRASHAFYDINQRRGVVLNAEVRTFIPEYGGTLRLRAAQIRQYSENSFHAKDGWVTTSEFGVPKYRTQASDIYLQPKPTGRVDPQTGQPETSLYVTSLQNRLFVENVPIFGLPYLSAPVEDPGIPIRKLEFGYTGILGFTAETAVAVDGLFGWDLPDDTNLLVGAGYYTKRGPNLGLKGDWEFQSALLGYPVRNQGLGDVFYINDQGNDNLGLGRRNLPPPNDNRGRVLLRNRTEIDPFTYLQTEVGHVFNNDRNFMEQFYENEWDNGKDLENLIFLNHQFDNLTGSLLFAGRTNNFENQTNWLPKADLTVLGEPLFQSPLLWSSHSSLGYGQSLQANGPPNPATDPFLPLYYYNGAEGAVTMSRHELSLPFQAGPVNFAPYLLGEAAYWQEDLTGDDLSRLYGSAGIRGSVQFSKYMPQVRNSVLGLNGLAHKAIFDMDYYVASSSADLSRVPQYNEFDDNAQERFRSRFLPIEFGGVLPARFDPRYYAVRSGAGRDVTSPYHELVDDQHTLWLGLRQRWQTKVGPPDRQRIIDWMELDLGTAIFPNGNRDNFGETFGMLNGRYAWHVSPRTSLLANGVADVFDMGQRVWNVGILTQRPARGSLYLGYRQVEAGPIESQLITTSMSYVLSPNLYVATLGASFDVAEGIDRGESLTVTRIGEYFLFHFGLGYDRSKNNVGVGVSLEPKFGNYGSDSVQLNSLLGLP